VYTAALEAEGVKVSVIKAGKFKAEGNPYEPLAAEARDHLQELVDSTYSAFVKGVARNRGVSVGEVREKYGQGRVLPAAQALAAGMVDRVASLSAVLEKLAGPGGGAAAKQASAELLRLRHEQRKRALGA
jgi:ClpP class serine protease